MDQLENLRILWIKAMREMNPELIKENQKSPTMFIGNWKIAPEHQRKYKSIVFNWNGNVLNEPKLPGHYYSSPSDNRKKWSYRANLEPSGLKTFYESLLSYAKTLDLASSKENLDKNEKLNFLEKDMENAIVENPGKYLDEEGLKLISRQYRIGNYIFDLLFEDKYGSKIIVEIQRGTLDRNHTYKILDYYHEYKEGNPNSYVELFVIANIIPVERKRRLNDLGISYKEIPVSDFQQ